jgi:RnfABCDGE-type electron transport complex G subunit
MAVRVSSVVIKLTALAATCGLLLGLASLHTAAQVAANQQAFAERQLLEVAGRKSEVRRVDPEHYLLIEAGETTGHVIGVETNDGYNGRISLWVGISTSGRLLGVRVRSHHETPGLGDRIELAVSDWILAFNDLHLAGGTRWDVRKYGGDFDQFSGATITPRAVVHAVRDGLTAFDEEFGRARHGQDEGEARSEL